MILEILLFSSNNFAAIKASMFPSLKIRKVSIRNIKIRKVSETRLTVTFMIAMMYNEAVMHIVLFHWNRLGSFLIVFF